MPSLNDYSYTKNDTMIPFVVFIVKNRKNVCVIFFGRDGKVNSKNIRFAYAEPPGGVKFSRRLWDAKRNPDPGSSFVLMFPRWKNISEFEFFDLSKDVGRHGIGQAQRFHFLEFRRSGKSAQV